MIQGLRINTLVFFLIIFLAVPQVGFAAINCPPNNTLSGFICILVDLINTALPVVAGIALLVFVWGLAKMILRAGDEKAREEGKQVMLWGIISLFVLISIYGILAFIFWSFFNYSPAGGFIPKLPT